MPAVAEAPSVRSSPVLLRLLGGDIVECAGNPVEIRSAKARALLVILAVAASQSAERARLCDILWDDRDDASARSNLRQALFALRGALRACGGPSITASADRIAIERPGARLDLDALIEGIATGGVGDEAADASGQVGMALHGFDALGTQAAQWAARQRGELGARLQAGLARIYENDATDARIARRAARAALAADPMNEAACRAFIRRSVALGEPAEALRAYNALYGQLDEDLEIEPSAETQALIVSLKLGEAAAAPPRPVVHHRGPPRVAVLPIFVDGGPAEAAHYAAALVEETVCLLTRLHEPVVVSTGSTRGLPVDVAPEDALAGMGVDYALCGALRPIGRRLHLALRLHDLAGRTISWSRNLTLESDDLGDLPCDLARSIVGVAVPALRVTELRRSWMKPPDDLSVYQMTLRARELVSLLDIDRLNDAAALLERAKTIDPYFAPIHVGCAEVCSIRIGQGWSRDRAADLASIEAALMRAVDLDGENGRALAFLGHTRANFGEARDEALALFDRAERAMPNDAETLLWSSPTFAYMGEPQEALRRAEAALALSPLDPLAFRFEHFLAIAYYAGGALEQAADWGLRSMARNGRYTSNLRVTAAALAGMGRTEAARRLAGRVLDLEPQFRVADFTRRGPYRDPTQRALYAERLVAAGLPA